MAAVGETRGHVAVPDATSLQLNAHFAHRIQESHTRPCPLLIRV